MSTPMGGIDGRDRSYGLLVASDLTSMDFVLYYIAASKHCFYANSGYLSGSISYFLIAQYCTPEPRALPNMGERSLGKPDPTPPFSNITSTSQSQSTSTTPTSPTSPATPPNKKSGPCTSDTIIPKPAAPGTGWATAWRQCIWDKWRWGVLIALAVVVSRLSTSG